MKVFYESQSNKSHSSSQKIRESSKCSRVHSVQKFDGPPPFFLDLKFEIQIQTGAAAVRHVPVRRRAAADRHPSGHAGLYPQGAG